MANTPSNQARSFLARWREKMASAASRLAGRPRAGRLGSLASLASWLTVLAGLALVSGASAQEPLKPPARELYVPFSELSVLLENQPQRVLLTREEFLDLVKQAEKKPDPAVPLPAVVASADYAVTIESERARLTGTLALEVLADGLHAVPLDLGQVGLLRATLDGQPASVGRADPAGPITLFVRGKGSHALILEMIAPVEQTAARQVLAFRLPHPAAARMTLSVPGDVEVKAGAQVVRRDVDAAAGVTRFELLPGAGDVSLEMTLNSHLQRTQRAVTAQSVVLDEVTQAYERLHATVSLKILYQPVDQFRFAVPDGFEVTEVSSPLLARWAVQAEGDRKVLDVRLRETTTEPVVLSVSAFRTPARMEAWTFPRLEPLDVVGQVDVVGLLLEDRLEANSVVSEGLVPINTEVLRQALPESVFRVEPGTPSVRPVVVYFAPQGNYRLAAQFARPPAALAVTTNVLLIVDETDLEIRGGFALLPEEEKLFRMEFALPPLWHLESVTGTDEQPLPFELYQSAERRRVEVRFPQGIPAGQEYRVYFHATQTPAGWLDDWPSRPADFPVFAVAGATRDAGAVAVQVADDLTARPDAIEALTPLDEAEKAPYGLEGVPTVLAYRYDAQPYRLGLTVERTRPRMVAETLAFFQVLPDAVRAHYEVIFEIDEARARRLALVLPQSTPRSLQIAGRGGVRLKEFTSEEMADGLRRWNVLLEEAHRGEVRLAVDFEQPQDAGQQAPMALPMLRAEGVSYQSGKIAVEGSAELDVALKTDARRIDVGELIDAEYVPGKRLLGVFGYVGDAPAVAVSVGRPKSYVLPSALVERALLTSVLSPMGESLTRAQFQLHTKALLLEVRLPAGSDLWSATVDGRPTKPQRDGKSLLVSLPAQNASAARALELVYRTPVAPLTSGDTPLAGQVALTAPKLLLRFDAGDAGREVPLADVQWHLTLPSGYTVAQSEGSVVRIQRERPPVAPLAFLQRLYRWAGGVPGLRLWHDRDTRAGILLGLVVTVLVVLGYLALRWMIRSRHKHWFQTFLAAAGCGVALLIVGMCLLPAQQAARESARFRAAPDAAAPAGEAPASAYPRDGEMGEFGLQAPGVFSADLDMKYRRDGLAAGQEAVLEDPFGEGDTGAERESLMGRRAGAAKSEQAEKESPQRGMTVILKGNEVVATEPAAAATPAAEAPASAPEAAQPTAQPVPAETPPTDAPATVPRRSRYSAMDLASQVDPFAAAPEGPGLPGAGAAPAKPAPTNAPYSIAKPVYETRTRAVKGLRTLPIALAEPTGSSATVSFQSLGVEPRLVVMLVSHPRYGALGWIAALAALAVGAALSRRTVGTKVRYVLIVGTAAALVSALADSTELVRLSNMVFLAAMALIPYYLLLPVCGRLWGGCCRSRAAAVGLGFAVLAALSAPESLAQEVRPVPMDRPVQIVEPGGPVEVPADAVIVPFDPAAEGIRPEDGKLLIPYDRYVELWNRAHPDRRIEAEKPPADWALAGAGYRTILVGEDSLLIQGQLVIDVFVDGYASVPLTLGGGMLARAELDGKPARVHTAQPVVPAEGQQPAQQQARPAVPEGMVVLYVSGKGRHTLDMDLRMKLDRRGGWRVVSGALPSAPATVLALTVPQAQTELRLSGVPDRPTLETDRPDQSLETTLGAGGAFSLQWRPKVAEAEVDRSLTSQSTATFDVQEDGLRLVWTLRLDFPRSTREFFRVDVPGDYLIEAVRGSNVRGWKAEPAGERQTVEITLLKEARDREEIALILTRHVPVGQDGESLRELSVPAVLVPEAALQAGQVTIRRSPLLEVIVAEATGVTRTDLAADANAPADAGQVSALGIQPLQAFRFATTPFTVKLTAAPVQARVSAVVQSLVKMAEYQPVLETRVLLSVERRPVYQVAMLVPADLDIRTVSAPGTYEWAVTPTESGRLLTIYLAQGQQGPVAVLVQGRLGSPGRTQQIGLPVLTVQGVERQQTDLAIQVDPAFNVEAVDLRDIQPILLEQAVGWIEENQREAVRLVLRARSGSYAGTLRLAAREPEVVATTLTNVRVTDRAIEETILIDFDIRQAGIRSLSFLLPAGMAEPRIQMPMLRQKRIEPAGADHPGWQRVQIELQDEVMGRRRVLVENDRGLTGGQQAVPIPVVETGRTERRAIALESGGRDEVLVVRRQGVEPLNRQLKQWEEIQTHGREAVVTAGARIWLAHTSLVLDPAGAFRAETLYQVDNTTEQFLEIRLPMGARLWTARVAGEPVKPAVDPAGKDKLAVRIPLVKTAPGETDYEVRLQYGGQIPPFAGAAARVAFPIVETVNIGIERSAVQLCLPEEYRWLDFDGTMRRVETQEDYRRTFVEYILGQSERLVKDATSGSAFAKVRAVENIKRIQGALAGVQSAPSMGEQVRLQIQANQSAITQTEGELAQAEPAQQQGEAQDNRARMNAYYSGQSTDRARNVVKDLGANWDYQPPTSGDVAEERSAEGGKAAGQFRGEWFAQNQLLSPATSSEESKPADGKGKADSSRGRALWGGSSAKRPQAPAQPAAPEVAQKRLKEQIQHRASPETEGVPLQQSLGTPVVEQQAGAEQAARKARSQSEAVTRYRERFNMQQQMQVEGQMAQQGQAVSSPTEPLPADATMPTMSSMGGMGGGMGGMGDGMSMRGGMPGAAGQPQGGPGGMAGPGAKEEPFLADLENMDVAGVPFDDNRSAAMLQYGGYAGSRAGGMAPQGGTGVPQADGGVVPVQTATGFVSLDVNLPWRGNVYRFTTPRGKAPEITARAISSELLGKVYRVAGLLVGLVAVLVVVRVVLGGWLRWLAGLAGTVLLLGLGLALLLLGIFPVGGAALFLVGVIRGLRRMAGKPRMDGAASGG